MAGGAFTSVSRLRKVAKYDTDMAVHLDMKRFYKMSDKERTAYGKEIYLDLFNKGYEPWNVYFVDTSCKPVFKGNTAYYKAVNPIIMIAESVDNMTGHNYEDWCDKLQKKAKTMR